MVDVGSALNPARPIRVRHGLLERFVKADGVLGSWSLRVVEGHRALVKQQEMYDCYVEQLRSDDPTRSDDELARLALRWVAAPTGAPPHSTGGAVDVTLIDASGAEVDMGTPFDTPFSEVGPSCRLDCTELAGPFLSRRRRLVAAMRAGGFVNYDWEWWHWSYGDQYWAWKTEATHAVYGRVDS